MLPFPHLVVCVDAPFALFFGRKSKSSSVLVGYGSIDGDDSWIVPLASYLSCDPSGSNSGDTSIDIYGLNN